MICVRIHADGIGELRKVFQRRSVVASGDEASERNGRDRLKRTRDGAVNRKRHLEDGNRLVLEADDGNLVQRVIDGNGRRNVQGGGKTNECNCSVTTATADLEKVDAV